MSTVLSDFGLKEVGVLDVKGDLNLPKRAVGIEIEMENAVGSYNPTTKAKKIWSYKEDHSLRDGGIEFISSPMNPNGLEGALTCLIDSFPKGAIAFSPRTSVHVHVNVQDIDTNKLPLLVRFYRLFESSFFEFVGQKRARNTYCCPLYLTNIPSFRTPQRWPKYTALNLRPVGTQGTVEFRHMHGTLDTHKLIMWVSAIVNLVEFVHQNQKGALQEMLYRTTQQSVADLFTTFTKSKIPFQSINLETLLLSKLDSSSPKSIRQASAYVKGLSTCAV